MAKRNAGSGMTRPEKIGGGVLLATYLAVLPKTSDYLFGLLEKLLGSGLPGGVRDLIYTGVLFCLTLVVFRGYLRRTARAFFDHMGNTLGAAGLGLVVFYGLNELCWRLLRMVPGEWENLNDRFVLDRLAAVPYGTILIVVILSPVIEEAIFRGYIFGNLREYHRGAAYGFSCVLFALVHVWPHVTGSPDWRQLLLLSQYLLPGAVMAWTFERSGSLWGSILLHGTVNGLSVWRAIK